MDVAGSVAMGLINTVIGSDQYDGTSYYPIFRNLTRAMDSGLDPSRLDGGRAAGIILSESVRTWFSKPAASGMLAALQRDAVVCGMPQHYVHNTLGGVFNAGFSTLYASAGSIMLLLLQRLDILNQLRNQKRLRTGVDELFRYTSSAQATSRFAVVDTRLGGIQIAAGSCIVTLMAAANRDPLVFDSPDEIRLDRTPNPHLAFASGAHTCLGARLAKTWIRRHN
jgi:cytochrome P450